MDEKKYKKFTIWVDSFPVGSYDSLDDAVKNAPLAIKRALVLEDIFEESLTDDLTSISEDLIILTPSRLEPGKYHRYRHLLRSYKLNGNLAFDHEAFESSAEEDPYKLDLI